MSQKLGSSLLKQASERQISSLRWALGATFRNPWKPDPPCLSGLLLMTLSWVGSRVLAPGTLWSFSGGGTCDYSGGWSLMVPLGGWGLMVSFWRAVPQPVVCFGVSVGLVWPKGNLSANGLGCIPVLLKICCKAYSTGACWPLEGLVLVLRWRSLGELSPIGIPWFECFQVFQFAGLESPKSEVQAWPLSEAPRLHIPHRTKEKGIEKE